VIGLLAVMDAAALYLSLSPLTAPASARPLLRMGYVALDDLAGTLGIAVDPDPDPADPIQLSQAEFDDAVRRLVSVGWKLERSQDEAWKHFHGWRVNYEAAAYGLALRLDAPPALWSGERRKGRNEVIQPVRPSHRVPLESEKEKLLQAGAKRRAARRAAEHELHAHHDDEVVSPEAQT
jgi:hypothetical protein